MKPLDGLRLILGILRTQAVYRCAHGGKLSVVVAIGTGLRRTATRPGDGVPRCYPARRLLIRASRSWVAIDDEPRSTFFGQIDLQPGSSPQADRRGASTDEGDHTLHRLPGSASSREESKDCQFA